MVSSIKNPDKANQTPDAPDKKKFLTSPTGARLLEKFADNLKTEAQQSSTDAEIQLGTIRKIQERAEILRTTLDKKIIDLKQLPGQINFLYLLLQQYCAQNSPVLFKDVEEKKGQVDLHFNALEQAKKHFRPEIAREATSRIIKDPEFSGEAITLCQEFLSAAITLLTVSEQIHTYKTETARQALQNVDITVDVEELPPLETQKTAFYTEARKQILDPLLTARSAKTVQLTSEEKRKPSKSDEKIKEIDREEARLKFVEEVVGPFVINNMMERLTKTLRNSLPEDADFESRLMDLFATKNLNLEREFSTSKKQPEEGDNEDTENGNDAKESAPRISMNGYLKGNDFSLSFNNGNVNLSGKLEGDRELIASELSRAKTILLAAYATEPEERAEFYRELMITHALSQTAKTASPAEKKGNSLYGPDRDYITGIQRVCRDMPELLGAIQAVINTTKTTYDLKDNPEGEKPLSETLNEALPNELALYGLRYMTDNQNPELRTSMENAYTETATALRSRQELSDPFTPLICDLRDVPKVINNIRQQASIAVYGSEDPAREISTLKAKTRNLERQLKEAEEALGKKQEMLNAVTEQEDDRNKELEESIATMRQRLQENRTAMQKNDETIRRLEAKTDSLESRANHQNKQLKEAKRLFTELKQTLITIISSLSKLGQVDDLFANNLGNIPEKQRIKAGLNIDPEELMTLVEETKTLKSGLEDLAQRIEKLDGEIVVT